MKKLSTLSRKKEELSFYIDEAMIETFGEKFLGTLKSQVDSGEEFQAGETFQIGWMLTRFVAGEGGGLELFEPDFEARLGINWRRGLVRTGYYSSICFSVCTELGQEPEMCHIGNTALVDLPHNADLTSFQMDRTDEGWEIHFGRKREGNVMEMTLYQAAMRQPLLIPFYLLPVGSSVSVTPSTISIQYKEKSLTIPPGGYLDQHFVQGEADDELEIIEPPKGTIKEKLDFVLDRRHYSVGEFIELGWFWFRIVKTNPVEVETLDCKAMASLTKDLSVVETIDALQKRTLESYGLTASPCSYLNTALLSASYNPSRKDLFIQRGHAGDVRDSGWYIGVENEERDMNDPRSFTVKPIYEISLQDERLLPYWLFPVGKRISFKTGTPRIKSFDPSA